MADNGSTLIGIFFDALKQKGKELLTPYPSSYTMKSLSDGLHSRSVFTGNSSEYDALGKMSPVLGNEF